MESGQELCSDVCAADELVRLRVMKIVAVSDSVSRDTACENVQDMQATFNTLFVNICNACSDMSVEQSIQITRHIMANNSAQVVAAVSATHCRQLLPDLSNALRIWPEQHYSLIDVQMSCRRPTQVAAGRGYAHMCNNVKTEKQSLCSPLNMNISSCHCSHAATVKYSSFYCRC